jgi:hypothetical protein
LWDHGEDEPAVRMVAALGYFWEMRGYLRVGEQALEEALARAPDTDPRLRATLLNRLGSILLWQGEPGQGEPERPRVVLEEALALGRGLEDADMTAQSLTLLGRLAQHVGLSGESMREATQLLEEALALYRQLGDRRGAAFVQTLLAVNALDQRTYEQAEHL